MNLSKSQWIARKIPGQYSQWVSDDKIASLWEFIAKCFKCDIRQISLHLNLNSLSVKSERVLIPKYWKSYYVCYNNSGLLEFSEIIGIPMETE